MTPLAQAKPYEIVFIEEPHGYLVDGRAVRSWSQVAKDAGLLPEFPDTAFAKVANAKYRGKQIHEACAMLIRGEPFNPQELHDESLPYVQAFLDYWRVHGAGRPRVETPLYCPRLDFCCTPDFFNDHTVYDIKTTDRPARSWGLQTAAQALAHDGAPRRCIIWLRPKLKSRNYEILDDDSRWFSMQDYRVVEEACRGEYDGPAITAWKALK
jgi:hypothetical protein